ncbi:PC-esterase domain-containing protein 1A isoform X2 [Acipenser ruthenus]|uniref:PC-esterase domain-containing protein 1A isoform X2 n=1 Tax=Acipenser ruthenus TaxID=7906 RepID=UPI002741ABE4|nr:PC-esterase domain-containing protein 1A isoform X2 [Acipenser ruthenus]
MKDICREHARLLLHNKFVVILGDSIQRAVYKDLVLLLQRDSFLTVSQLRAKGELNFEQDFLVEGGKIGGLTNGTEYKEVRQFRSAHHLVRFYFLTRVYSKYVESVLADFQAGPQPDVLIVNSCVWDVSRYGPSSMEEYRVNLGKFFTRLGEVLLPECLVMWNMAMPLGKKIYGGFLIPELQHLDQSLRSDIIEANFYSATLADSHRFDVLDLHYHFRFELQNRTKDGVHWNQLAHRKITFLLLAHIAEAWNVEVPDSKRQNLLCNENIEYNPAACQHGNREVRQPYIYSSPAAAGGLALPRETEPAWRLNSNYQNLPWKACGGGPNTSFQDDSPLIGVSASVMGFTTGYISFEEHHSNHYNRNNTMNNEPCWNENRRFLAPNQYFHREALRPAPEIHAFHYREPLFGGMSMYNDAPYLSAAYENRSNVVMKQRPVKRYYPPNKRPNAKPYYRN